MSESEPLPYEILFRWTDKGIFSAGHTIRRDATTGQILDPMPIGKDKEFPLPKILAAIDSALLAKAGEVDTIKAQLKELTVKHKEAIETLAQIDPEYKRAHLQKQKEALAAQAASLDAEMAALSKKK